LISKLIHDLPGGVTLRPAGHQVSKLIGSETSCNKNNPDDPYRPPAQDYYNDYCQKTYGNEGEP
jgi:hypothetical protein